MKWKLSRPELERIALLLEESVARGAVADRRLRDEALNLLRDERQRRQRAQEKITMRKTYAAQAARDAFRRYSRKDEYL